MNEEIQEENIDSPEEENLEETGDEEETPEEEVEETPEELEPDVRSVSETPAETPSDEPELDPDDAATIGKVVKKQLEPVMTGLKQVQALKDEVEVDTYIRDNPECNKHRATALKWMKNPAYSNVPAHNIMAILTAKEQQKIGARKEREASKKAAETKDTGTTVRKGEVATDWSSMSKEEFEAKKQEVLHNNRR